MTVVTSSLSEAIKTQYEKRFLARALPRLVHGKWAMQPRLSNEGSWTIRSYPALSVTSLPLVEGVTPAETQLGSPTKMVMSPTYYGAWFGFTDLVELTTFDPVLSEYTAILSEQAAVSMDSIIRDALVSDATASYTGSGISSYTSLDSPAHDITFNDLLKLTAELEAANAQPIEGTQYVCILHPYSITSLMNDPMFVELFVREPSATNPIRQGITKIGTLLNLNIYITSNAKRYVDGGVGSDDVYTALVLARESYAILGLNGYQVPASDDSMGAGGGNQTGKALKPVDVIVKPKGSAGTADPLDQRGTIGWKAAMTPDVLNANWVRCLYHTNRMS